MTDLHTLLRESAPAPSSPLDMSAVRQRAARLGTRRFFAWVAGLGVATGLVVPIGGPLLVSGDRAEQVATDVRAPDNGDQEGDEGVDRVEDRADAGSSASDAGNDEGSESASEASASAPPSTVARGTASGSVADAAAPAAPAEHFPAAAVCTVDTVGLGAGHERVCRFTATAAGGASLTTTGPISPPPGIKAEVIVTRNGESTTYVVTEDTVRAGEVGTFRCGRIIEVGDLVEVVLTNSPAPDGHRTTLGAGEGWECWNNRGSE